MSVEAVEPCMPLLNTIVLCAMHCADTVPVHVSAHPHHVSRARASDRSGVVYTSALLCLCPLPQLQHHPTLPQPPRPPSRHAPTGCSAALPFTLASVPHPPQYWACGHLPPPQHQTPAAPPADGPPAPPPSPVPTPAPAACTRCRCPAHPPSSSHSLRRPHVALASTPATGSSSVSTTLPVASLLSLQQRGRGSKQQSVQASDSATCRHARKH